MHFIVIETDNPNVVTIPATEGRATVREVCRAGSLAQLADMIDGLVVRQMTAGRRPDLGAIDFSNAAMGQVGASLPPERDPEDVLDHLGYSVEKADPSTVIVIDDDGEQ